MSLSAMVRGLAARIRSFYHGVRRRNEVESEMREEFAHHLEMRSAELVRRGLAPAEAGRRARLEFGRTDAHLEGARTARGLRVVDQIRFSWIDVRFVRFQSPGEPGGGEWREIVGVVKHLGVNMLNEQSGGAVYLPAAPGEINPVQIGIHAGADPARLIPRVRGLASKVDPDLRMGRVAVLSDVYQSDWYLMIAVAGGLALLVGVLLAMAIIGIYAMLSVSERTREIGIRSALGASKYALVTAILRRSLVQVGLGSLIGLPVAGLVVFELTGKGGQAHSPAMAAVGALGLAAGIVLIVGVFSCLAPALRVLGIQANEALRRET